MAKKTMTCTFTVTDEGKGNNEIDLDATCFCGAKIKYQCTHLSSYMNGKCLKCGAQLIIITDRQKDFR